jgi:hypothetical protein
MDRQNIFPVQAMTDSSSEPAIKLEGQKVVFDKKVSLLPVDIKREETAKVKTVNRKQH